METPALGHLMGAYFHQDWDLDGLDDHQTVDAFVRESPGLAGDLPGEVDHVLRQMPDEAQVQAYLEALGCDIRPPDGSYRTWLTQLAAYAREALTHPH
jgi:hypothetical protein